MPHQCTSCGRTFADGSKQMLSGCPDCDGNKFQFMPAGTVDGDAGGDGAGSGPATSDGPGAGGRRLAAGGTASKKRPADSDTADAVPAGDTAPTGDVSGAVASETVGDSGREATARNPGRDGRGADGRGAVNRAAATVREWVGSGDGADAPDSSTDSPDETPDSKDRGSDSEDRTTGQVPEDSAQASARRDVVSEDELPEEPPETARAPTDASASTGARAPDGDSVSADASARDDAATPAEPPETDTPEDGTTVVDTPDDRNPGLAELREELNSQFESIRIVEPGQYELNLMELYEREEYIISLQEDGKYVIEVPDAWDAPER